MKILTFDTETNGKADFKLASSHPCQPRLVQLAGVLHTETGVEIAHFKTLVQPDGFTISPELTAIHGISHEHAMTYGLPRQLALRMLVAWSNQADYSVAFNSGFDRIVVEKELSVAWDKEENEKLMAMFRRKRLECAMTPMTDVCKLPGFGRGGGYKWPKLEEAYFHIKQAKPDKSHDALADVRATVVVWSWLLEQKLVAHPV